MSFSPAWLPRNTNGGYYSPGKTHGLAKKLECYDLYCVLSEESYPNKPSTRLLAKQAHVGQTFARKIIQEIEEYGGVIDPEDIKAHKKNKRDTGIGCRTLSTCHEAYLIALLISNPARTLEDYQRELFQQFYVTISESTLSNWFLRRFDERGAFVKVNKVPIDKFCPANVSRWLVSCSSSSASDASTWPILSSSEADTLRLLLTSLSTSTLLLLVLILLSVDPINRFDTMATNMCF